MTAEKLQMLEEATMQDKIFRNVSKKENERKTRRMAQYKISQLLTNLEKKYSRSNSAHLATQMAETSYFSGGHRSRSRSGTAKQNRKRRFEKRRYDSMINVKDAPLRSLKRFYSGLRSQSLKSGSRSKSKESKKETINLMINNPPTGLQILMDEAKSIENSPSIFPKTATLKSSQMQYFL